MSKVVLTTSISSNYQDLPERWYHFPKRYLRVIRAAVGNEAVFYQPRRDLGPSSSGGSQAYTAVARIAAVRPDPNSATHYFADLSDYMAFDQEVPYRLASHYFESALQKEDGTANRGKFGWSVRPLTDPEFEEIFRAGFAQTLPALITTPQEYDTGIVYERPTLTLEITRKVRDLAFRRRIRTAYENTCAVTGLTIVAPNGSVEVQAAHIRSVAGNGPDTTTNGIALSATVHWMFDQGLFTISDDMRILVASSGIPRHALVAFAPDTIVRKPKNHADHPDRNHLRWHRENVFLG